MDIGFNRLEAKIRARTSMRLARPNAMLVTLVFLLLTEILSSIIGLLGAGILENMSYYVLWRYDPEDILRVIWNEYSTRIMVMLAASPLLSLYTTVMNFGYLSYSLRLARNENPGYSHLFDGFAKLGRVLWMAILKYIFVLLWTLLGVLPGMVILVAVAVADMDVTAILGVYIALVILGAALGAIASLRYSQAEYFLLDDPSRTARECIAMSKGVMKGWKMELFVLGLSFLGWALVGGLIGSLLGQVWYPLGTVGTVLFSMWYLPYYHATLANFYDYITGQLRSFPQGEPGWEEPGPGGPAAF